jgi:hypothetical protein
MGRMMCYDVCKGEKRYPNAVSFHAREDNLDSIFANRE